MRQFIIAAGIFLGVAASAAAQQAAPELTLREAIQMATEQNPESTAAHADSAASTASLHLARTAYLPQLNFTEDISRGDDPVYVFGSRLRQQQFTSADFALNSLNTPQPIGNFATRFSGGWRLFDSLHTRYSILGARNMQQSSAESEKAVNQKVVLDVVQAYEAVLYAERETAVAGHEQQTAQALLAGAADHVKAGLAVESDRMAAEVNLASRRMETVAAENNLQLAWMQLRIATGNLALAQTTLQPIEPQEFEQRALTDEVAAAMKFRPDLKAANDVDSAQQTAVKAARTAFGPTVDAYGNWEQDRGTFAGSAGNNWVAGVQIRVDVFPVGKRAELQQQIAARQKADAQLLQWREQVQLQVNQAHLQQQTAGMQMKIENDALAQANEGLRIVHNRYQAGLATITDLLRAEDAERQTEAAYWQAVYGNAMAYARKLYATGQLTPDAAEELQ